MTTDQGETGPPFRPVIRSQADLEATWRRLMSPLGFGRTSLWLMLIQPDDMPLPQLLEIQDCEARPTREQIDQLTATLRELEAEFRCADEPAGDVGVRWAALLSRPGGDGVADDDRAWAERLHAACRRAGVPLAPMHVATDLDIWPITLDDLGEAVTDVQERGRRHAS